MADAPVVWRNYRPGNGTEGDYLRAQLCDRCVKDHDWHVPPYEGDDSCPIILDALAGEHSYPNPDGPPQWSYYPDEGRYECAEFQGPCECDWQREAMTYTSSVQAEGPIIRVTLHGTPGLRSATQTPRNGSRSVTGGVKDPGAVQTVLWED